MGILEFINKNCERLINMDKDEFFSLPPKEFNKKLDELMGNMTKNDFNSVNITKEDIDELFDLMNEAKERVKKMKNEFNEDITKKEKKNEDKKEVSITITGISTEDGFENLHLESQGKPKDVIMLISIFTSEYLKCRFNGTQNQLEILDAINKETINLIKEGEDDDE